MKEEEKLKIDRIPCCPKTKMRLKKFQANKEFKTYDEAINYLLNKVEKKK